MPAGPNRLSGQFGWPADDIQTGAAGSCPGDGRAGLDAASRAPHLPGFAS